MSEPAWQQGEVGVALVGDRVAVLTLNAPERRNALTLQFVTEILAGVDWIESRDDIGAVVIAGNGPAFCAGADLGELDGANDDVLRAIYLAFLRVLRLPIPTVAAVGGPAVGAGLNLALACDLRVASPSAVFDARFARIGLHPGGGVSWLLRQAVGAQLATAMLLFSQRLRGEEAAARGLAWSCVGETDLLPVATALAASAAQAPAELARLIKRTLGDTAGLAHADALELELERQVWTTTQPWYGALRGPRVSERKE